MKHKCTSYDCISFIKNVCDNNMCRNCICYYYKQVYGSIYYNLYFLRYNCVGDVVIIIGSTFYIVIIFMR